MEITKIIMQGLLFISAIFAIIIFAGCMGSQDDNKRNSSILMMIASILLMVFIQHYWV